MERGREEMSKVLFELLFNTLNVGYGDGGG